MSESTLSITLDDLRNAVSYYLGWGRNYTTWSPSTTYSLGQRVRPTAPNGYVYECTTAGSSGTTEPSWGTTIGGQTSEGTGKCAWTCLRYAADESAELDEVIRIGLRQFYYHDLIIPGETMPHAWSFLKPVSSITLWTSVAGGAMSVSTTQITVTDSTFYSSMVGATLVAHTSGTEYTILSVVSDKVVVVDADATADDGDTFTIAATGDYRLPDDFGFLIGDLTYSSDDGFPRITVVSDNMIRTMRSRSDVTGPPSMAAVVPLSTTGASGQRFALMVWPTPDSDYTVRYRYSVLPNALTDSYGYPFGGAMHAETIRASCLAAAESLFNDTRGVKWSEFQSRLVASIGMDRRLSAPDMLTAPRYTGWYEFNNYATYEGSVPS